MKPIASIVLCFLALGSFAASAQTQDSYRSVVVTTATGNVMKFDLSGGVDVNFSDTELLITAAGTEVALPISDFARFDFSTESAGAVSVPRPDISVRVIGSELYISGLAADSRITVSTLSGLLITDSRCDDLGNFALQNLASGIYIIKTELSTLKISIK